MTEPYPNAPLVMVAAEIRFPELPHNRLRACTEQLKDEFRPILPLYDVVNHTKVEFVAGGGQSRHEVFTFPRFKTRDSTMALVINPTSLVIETTRYTGYEDLRPTLEAVIRSVSEILGPDGLNRIGLRYIDEIRVPNISAHPGDWSGYIDEHLLAAVDDKFLPDGLLPHSWVGRVQYKTGNASMLTLHYGPMDGYAVGPASDGAKRRDVPPPGPFFLLDSDSAWSAEDIVPEFTTDVAMTILDEIHAPVSAIFHAACTDSLRMTVFSKPAKRAKR